MKSLTPERIRAVVRTAWQVAYCGGIASLLGLVVAVAVPMGHLEAVWYASTAVFAVVAGLLVVAYEIRRQSVGQAEAAVPEHVHAKWSDTRARLLDSPEAKARTSFWDDLNERVKDPDFREAYNLTSMQIRAADTVANAEGPDRDHMLGQLVAAGIVAADQWLTVRAHRRMKDTNRRLLVGHIVNALWPEIEQAAIGIAEYIATSKENDA